MFFFQKSSENGAASCFWINILFNSKVDCNWTGSQDHYRSKKILIKQASLTIFPQSWRRPPPCLPNGNAHVCGFPNAERRVTVYSGGLGVGVCSLIFSAAAQGPYGTWIGGTLWRGVPEGGSGEGGKGGDAGMEGKSLEHSCSWICLVFSKFLDMMNVAMLHVHVCKRCQARPSPGCTKTICECILTCFDMYNSMSIHPSNCNPKEFKTYHLHHDNLSPRLILYFNLPNIWGAPDGKYAVLKVWVDKHCYEQSRNIPHLELYCRWGLNKNFYCEIKWRLKYIKIW